MIAQRLPSSAAPRAPRDERRHRRLRRRRYVELFRGAAGPRRPRDWTDAWVGSSVEALAVSILGAVAAWLLVMVVAVWWATP